MPVMVPSTIFPNPSRNSICVMVAGAPVLTSTILSFNIFFAGDVACCHNTMLQISQPIPHVTTKSNESRSSAPKRTPLSQGTTEPEPEPPKLFLPIGGGGGGVENGSDIEVSLQLRSKRIEPARHIVSHQGLACEQPTKGPP